MQTKIKPNTKQTCYQQPYPATLGAKNLGIQQQQNNYSIQEMNLIQASTLGQQQSFQASSIPQTYGLPAQMFKPAVAQQPIMVLQEQPSNIRQITKQPSSSKSSSSLLAKTENVNQQMVSYEQPWMNQQTNKNLQQSSSQGGLQYSKQIDHKIANIEGIDIQNNLNNLYDKSKSSNNSNSDMHQSSGRVIKKHQRHCSEALIPKKLLLLGPGTIQNIESKEIPLNKENSGFYIPQTSKEDRNSSKIKKGLTTGEIDPSMVGLNQTENRQNKVINDGNWMVIGSDDIKRQRHSRQNSLNMVSLRQPNEVEISQQQQQQQQFQIGDLLKFQTYDQRKDSSSNYHQKEIKIPDNRNAPWDIQNNFLMQDSSLKPIQYASKTVSSTSSTNSISNIKKSDQSYQNSKQIIPNSISTSNIQANQNIYPHQQLPRSATFNTLQYNSSKQPVIQGQLTAPIEKQINQQILKQPKNITIQPQNAQNRNIQNKNEGYFEYQQYDQQDSNSKQLRKIEQINFSSNNYASFDIANRKNSEINYHGSVSQQQNNSNNTTQNCSRQSAYPLSPNNTVTSKNTSQNSSQILGQTSSNSSRSPHRSSSQKVTFGGQQFNTDSTSNIRSYEQIAQQNNLSKINHSSISANGRINLDITQNDTITSKPISSCNSLIYPQQVPDGVANIYIPQNLSQNNYHCYPFAPPSSQTNITFAEQLKIEKTKKLCLQDNNSSQFQQSSLQQQFAKSKQQPLSCNNSTSHHGNDTQQFTPFSAADTTAGFTKDFLSIGKSEGSSKQHSALKSYDPSRKNSGSSLLPLNFGLYEPLTQYEDNTIAPLPNSDQDSKYFTLQYNKGPKQVQEQEKVSLQSHQKFLLQQENQQYQPGNISNYDVSKSSQKLLAVIPGKSGGKASYLIQDEETQGTLKTIQTSQLRLPSTIDNNPSMPYPNSTQFNLQNLRETPIGILTQESNTGKSTSNNTMNNSNKDSFWNMNNNNQQYASNLQNNAPNQQNLPKWYLHDSQGAFQTNKDEKTPKESSQQLALLESLSVLQQEQLIESINIRQLDSESSSLTQISTQRDELLPRIDKLECLPQHQSNERVTQNSYTQQLTQGLIKDTMSNKGVPLNVKPRDSFLADIEELTRQSQQNYGNKQSVFPAGIVYSSIESIPFFDYPKASNIQKDIEKPKTTTINQDYLLAEQIKKDNRLLGEEDQSNSEDEENFLDFAELVCEEGDIAEQFKDSEKIVLQPTSAEGQIEQSYGFNNVEALTNKLSTSKKSGLNQTTSQISGGKNQSLNDFQQETKINFQLAIEESREQKESRIRRELSEFAKESEQPIFGSDNLEYLVMRDTDYAPDPNYLTPDKQANITVSMRAILFDWMMEVSEEFGLKRETYHIAINLVDRYLSNSLHIKKRDLQLLGVTSLYISAKLEEIYPPKIGDFVCSTNNGYKPEEINQFELKILQALKFMINPPTLNMWSNWFMSQWDIFIVTSEIATSSQLTQSSNVQFKQPDEHSYLLFREFMQAVDVSVLDITSLQCDPRYMLASIMYIVLGKGFGLFDSTTVTEQFTQGNLFFYRNDEFNDIFDDFAKLSFGFPLSSILQTIQYVALFFEVPLNKELPSSAKNDKDNVFKGYYEDFLAFQTHNKEQLQIIQAKL